MQLEHYTISHVHQDKVPIGYHFSFLGMRGQAWCLQVCHCVTGGSTNPGGSPSPGDTPHSLLGCSQSLGAADQVECRDDEGDGQGRKRTADAALLLGHVQVLTGSVVWMLQVEELHEGTCHDAELTCQCCALHAEVQPAST